MSFTTSLVGGGPEGGVTLGSFESVPLGGVLAAVVGAEAGEGVFARGGGGVRGWLSFLSLAPVPLTMSLTTSLVGGGPEGGVTLGSLESVPLVGVLAAVVGVEAVEDVFAGVVVVMRALSSLLSLPTVIVLEPPDPQPPITAA